ncbi:MAG TPA: phosphoenolpyruvate carboxylase [Actinomycetota bacterium]|nr:phosphoenolpyruvate carboxylase [Actinomycetota bacterium]
MPTELRHDVRMLTTTLGEAIAEHRGPGLLADVEDLRRATIAQRGRPTEARRARVVELTASLDAGRAEHVIRAFTCYFQLVNLAEERHRIRTLRARSNGPRPLEGSVAALGELATPSSFDDLLIRPVLTAHPTEAKRRAVAEHVWRIGDLLDRLDDPRPGQPERAETMRHLREEITGLWLTDPVRHSRPEPLDEVRAMLALFDQTVFTTLPLVYREVDRAMDPEGSGAVPPAFPPFLRWGTWVGGDRDGNPTVTAETTRAASAIATDHVLRGLEAAARRIARSLSVSDRDVPPSAALRRTLERDERAVPGPARELVRKLPDAPHRRKLGLAAHRLAATRSGGRGAYGEASEFIEDLDVLQRSLDAGGAPGLAWGELQHLRWQAETFGFHLAEMEVRQHADVLHAALRELAPRAAGNAQALDRIARGKGQAPREGTSAATREVLATFRAIREIQDPLGTVACERVIVSFTRSAADLAGVRALARLASPERPAEVQPVPLFESRNELSTATTILDEWVSLPGTRQMLRRRRGELEVMVGYSDSAKEAGVLAANIELYRAQRAMAAWSRGHDLRLTIFHGRGGALGRGGGPASRAILGQPPGSVGGRFTVTEQGEMAFARYGDATLARRHLEQLTHAVVRATAGGDEPDPADGFEAELQSMAEASREAYERLVGSPGFVRFFRKVTPIAQISTLPIASRPVARGLGRGDELDDLRAIPWVFAWGQSRVNLPGWYGLGTGLDAVARRRGGLTTLRAMFRDWPFFTAMIENAELSLAKADPGIAELYMSRGGRDDLAADIRDEMARTRELVLQVAGHPDLLDCRPELQQAVELRNPYVDALSFLQLRFLDGRGRAERLVQATVNGVSAGLRNTG